MEKATSDVKTVVRSICVASSYALSPDDDEHTEEHLERLGMIAQVSCGAFVRQTIPQRGPPDKRQIVESAEALTARCIVPNRHALCREDVMLKATISYLATVVRNTHVASSYAPRRSLDTDLLAAAPEHGSAAAQAQRRQRPMQLAAIVRRPISRRRISQA